MPVSIRIVSAVVCGISLLLAGCRGDGIEPIENLVPVKGTVTFKDQPIPHGTISFVPKDPAGHSAVGKIVDGKFTMATSASAPGVVAGDYKVRIEAIDGPADAPPPLPNEPRKAVKSLIPAKYNNPETSGLQVEVSDGMADIEWDLLPE